MRKNIKYFILVILEIASLFIGLFCPYIVHDGNIYTGVDILKDKPDAYLLSFYIMAISFSIIVFLLNLGSIFVKRNNRIHYYFLIVISTFKVASVATIFFLNSDISYGLYVSEIVYIFELLAILSFQYLSSKGL